MARRRMFSLAIIDTDLFMDMSLSAQALYFHLSLRADDDGFIQNVKKIVRMVGSNDDDLKVLFAKELVIPFETGVCVVRHWNTHNYIQKDRYTPTVCVEEMALLSQENNMYTQMYPRCIQDVSKMEAQVRLGKVRLGKVSEGREKTVAKATPPTSSQNQKSKYGEYKNVLLTLNEFEKLKDKFSNYENKIKNLDEYLEMKGAKYKCHYLVIIKWAKADEGDETSEVKAVTKSAIDKMIEKEKEEDNE